MSIDNAVDAPTLVVGDIAHYEGLPTSARGLWEITAVTERDTLIARQITPDDGNRQLGSGYSWWYSNPITQDWSAHGMKPLVRGKITEVPSLPVGTVLDYHGTGRWENQAPYVVATHDTDQTVRITYGTDESYWFDYGTVTADFTVSITNFQAPEVREPVHQALVTYNDAGEFIQRLREVHDHELELAYIMHEAKVNYAKAAESERDLRTARHELVAYKERLYDYVVSVATDKEWCEAGTNRHLLAMDLPEWSKERDYEVSITLTYNTTITVTATDEDSAGELAENEWSDHFSTSYESPDVTIDEVCEA